MKKKFVFLFFSVVFLPVIVQAQSSKTNGPQRKVLFTMNEREVLLYDDEFICNFQLKEGRWACGVIDTLTQRTTFVWNGERKYDAGSFDYVDLTHYESSIQRFYTYNGSYISTSEGLFGPYYSVYSYIFGSDFSYSLLDNAFDYIGRKFIYKRVKDGEYYVHDQDGVEYRLESGRSEFKSGNGSHWAELLQGDRQLMIDGRRYELPLPVGARIDRNYPTDLFLFDDGTCFYNVHIIDDQNASATMKLHISNGEVRVLRESESFDFISKKVCAANSEERKSYFFNERTAFTTSFTYTNNYGEEEDWYGYRLRDRSGKHEFISTWDKNYVEIDGKRYGNQPPVSAYFDHNENAFVWITVEGRQLVQYSLKFAQ